MRMVGGRCSQAPVRRQRKLSSMIETMLSFRDTWTAAIITAGIDIMLNAARSACGPDCQMVM
jgi:hypothetical protein